MLRRTVQSQLPPLTLLSLLFITWTALRHTFNTPIPLIMITSESMTPAFNIGDVLLVSNPLGVIEVGDIAVCWLKGRQLPMVHRIVKRIATERGDVNSKDIVYRYLTKGDNNELDDVVIYDSGETDIGRSDIVGVVRGSIPYLGVPLLYLRRAFGQKIRSISSFE